MAAFHEHYDVLVSPMMPITAFEAGHNVPPGSGMTEWMQWTPFTYPSTSPNNRRRQCRAGWQR